MPRHSLWLIPSLLLSLSACSIYEPMSLPGSQPGSKPQPTTTTKTPTSTPTPVPQSQRPEPTVSAPELQAPISGVPQPTGPAAFLLEQAERERRAGNLGGAATSIERAMRIAPGNPWLNLELARVRLEQSNYTQAEQLAKRALAQAGGDRDLQSACWELTAQARRAAGDLDGAAAAMRRANVTSPSGRP